MSKLFNKRLLNKLELCSNVGKRWSSGCSMPSPIVVVSALSFNLLNGYTVALIDTFFEDE